MKAKDLSTVWGAPDNTRLTKKQISIRLPVRVASQVEAILKMYPRRSRTEVIGDLLSAALRDFYEGLESKAGEFLDRNPENKNNIFYDEGPKGRFVAYANEALREMEAELGNEDPELLPLPVVEQTSQDQ